MLLSIRRPSREHGARILSLFWLLTLTAACQIAIPRMACGGQDSIRPSVLKVHSVRRAPDVVRPWTKGQPTEVSGTGFVIEGNRILTNAHVVAYASQIYVQPYQSAEKYPAKVAVLSLSIDLAVLTVEDEALLANRPALPLDDGLPRDQAPVNVFGYPVGGDELSVTEGITSRIEYTSYYYGTQGLRIQIDAAINPGNSGGPAISHDKVIGVAFAGLSDAENIGYLIPIDEVRMFLDDVADGKYDGKPQLWEEMQTTENEALRASLGLAKEVGGCMVTRLAEKSETYPLRERDVITHIGPHALDQTGNVRLSDDLKVRFVYYVPKLAHDGVVPLTVLRDGQETQVEAPVSSRPNLVIPYTYGGYPSYFVYGPISFSVATADFVRTLGSSERWMTYLARQASPLVTRMYDQQRFAGEELVIVTAPFFSHRMTKGYTSPAMQVVETVNGTPVRNLLHLAELLRDCQDKFIEFRFAGNYTETIVFPRAEMASATEEILSDNGIRNRSSEDLSHIWKD